MFGRKKMYKKGLADAMQAYEAFGKKQEAAIAHMREEIRKGQKLEEALNDTIASLGDDIAGLYDYLNAQEKRALYHLSTPLDIKDLDKEEQQYLLAILYQLASDEGDLLTDYQRMFIRSVQRYLEITNPQTEADLSAVGDIDSLEVQKAFLQTVLEFFYLQDGDELSDTQEEFLGCFSVNKRQALLIEERVSRLFDVMKAEGIAEKYGYVSEGEGEENAPIQEDAPSTAIHHTDPEFIELKSDYADNAVKSVSPLFNCTETRSYCFLLPCKKCINKRDGSLFSFRHLPDVGIGEIYQVDSIPDTIVIRSYDSNGKVYAIGLFDLAKDCYTEIDHSKDRLCLLCTQNHYIVYGNWQTNDIFVYDASNKEIFTIPRPTQNGSSKGYDMIAGIASPYLYLSVPTSQNNSSLYKINLASTNLTPRLIQGFTIPGISSGSSFSQRIMKICGEQLYFIDYNEGGIMCGKEYLKIFKGNLKNKTIETLVSIIDEVGSNQNIYPSVNNISDQYITYRVENGKIYLLELETGKIQELVPRSSAWSRMSLWIIPCADWNAHLNRFPILGKWMYFEKEDDNHIYSIDINYPGRVKTLNK